eukprot:2214339-Amphidinium_carterae.1
MFEFVGNLEAGTESALRHALRVYWYAFVVVSDAASGKENKFWAVTCSVVLAWTKRPKPDTANLCCPPGIVQFFYNEWSADMIVMLRPSGDGNVGAADMVRSGHAQ